MHTCTAAAEEMECEKRQQHILRPGGGGAPGAGGGGGGAPGGGGGGTDGLRSDLSDAALMSLMRVEVADDSPTLASSGKLPV